MDRPRNCAVENSQISHPCLNGSVIGPYYSKGIGHWGIQQLAYLSAKIVDTYCSYFKCGKKKKTRVYIYFRDVNERKIIIVFNTTFFTLFLVIYSNFL